MAGWGAGQVAGLPARWWRSSLPLRVVVTAVAGSLVVLLLAGFVLMEQATSGIVAGMKDQSAAEASEALDYVEQDLRTAGAGQSSSETLARVAVQAVQRGSVGDQYHVVLQGPVSDVLTPDLDASSVPAELRLAVQTGETGVLHITPTEVRYLDGTPSQPGMVVGSTVVAPGGTRYPIYFIFPMTREVATLAVLRRAALTTGGIVLVVMGVLGYALARQTLAPLRAARLAAETLASGRLTDRMPIRGTDDLARLAVSMNHMAHQLQQRIRQLEDLSRVQQRFVSDVSHELRTPLTTVRMAADLLYDAHEDFPPLESRSAVLMRTELDRFEALLSDLLEISRFDAGAVDLVLDEVDVAELVANEVEALRPLAETGGSELIIHSDAPAIIEGDARRISRVLRNLISNAIEHGERKPIDITVGQSTSAVAVTVRDHGVGFTAVEAQQVFHRFWRADPARTRRIGGTGLGLAISLEDVHLHQGWLNAWGRPGMGAQFRVTLPRDQSSPLLASPLPMVPADTGGPRTSLEVGS